MKNELRYGGNIILGLYLLLASAFLRRQRIQHSQIQTKRG
jgi:uncharacterized membrane protein